MKVIWTDYLKYRSHKRGFNLSTLENILLYSSERYFDTMTQRMVVIGKHGKSLVMIPYEKKKESIVPITIHATTKQQINFRINTRRFIIE